MIDPSEVDHVQMPVPQYPTSDESEGTFRSELRDLVDSRLQLPPDDPSGSFTSTQSGHVAPLANGQPSSPQDRRRRSSKKDRHSAREMARLLANEEAEAKSMRKYLRAALDRLDGETRRAQEAERRALEIAERFRVVNEARQTAQNELTRTTEELRLWRNQFENAQRELLRARDLFKDLEDQRNNAESDATKYRAMARKLSEERKIVQAREEGRREGYEEGLRRGMEQGRTDDYNNRRPRDEVLVEDDDDDDEGPVQEREYERRRPEDVGSIRSESIAPLEIPTRVPLNNLSFRNGTQFHENFTPASTATRSLAPVQEAPPPPPEPPRMVRPPSVPQTRAPPPQDRPRSSLQDRPPTILHNRPSSVHHSENDGPPDNYIPPADGSGNIGFPPPHSFARGSPYREVQPLPVPEPTNVTANFAQVPDPGMRDIYGGGKTRSSPPSIAESVPSSMHSTNVSQYEILAPTRGGQKRDKGGLGPTLDRIDEVSSSMEYSPGYERRSIPAPVTFPVASQDSEWGEGSQGGRSRKNSHQSLGNGTPRSRTASQGGQRSVDQRPVEDTRYSSTSGIDNWRREAATSDPKPPQYPLPLASNKPVYPSGLRHEVSSSSSLQDQSRPRSVTMPRPRSPVGPRSTTPTRGTPVRAQLDLPRSYMQQQSSPAASAATSGEYSFHVVPPSETPSVTSPLMPTMDGGMLSPNGMPAPLPPPADPVEMVPTEPNTPTQRQRSLGVPMPPPPSVGGFPPGFIPVAPPSRPSTTVPSPAPSMQQSRTHPGGMPGGPTWNMKAGPDRAASAQGRPRIPTPQMTYEAAPMPEGISYPTPPFGRPRDSPRLASAALDTMSPRSNSSRLSGGAGSHQRSLSLNAGQTPGMAALSLSANPAPKLRKMPSSESVGSHVSGKSRASASISHFDPTQYVDIAALASSEDLLSSMQSPTTAANTKANSGLRTLGGAFRTPGSASPGPSAALLPPAPPPFTSSWGEPDPEPAPEPAPVVPTIVRGKGGKKGKKR